MTKLPPPPPMTSDEIVGHLRDYWMETLGATEVEAELRAERGFQHLLLTGAIREWGFDAAANTLYETHVPAVSETIVYVLMQKKEEQ